MKLSEFFVVCLIGISICICGILLGDIKQNQKQQIAQNDQIILMLSRGGVHDTSNDFGSKMLKAKDWKKE